jgi:hypothetical protein
MLSHISHPTKQTTKYGSFLPKYFEGSFRYDLYTSHSTGDEVLEHILSLGKNDFSPVKIESATYAERKKCHCCFAGYSHTVALCEDRQQSK